MIERLSAQLRARGYHIMLFTADNRHAADPLLEEILRYQVDGLILASTTLSSALAAECALAGIPVLLFNRTTETADVSSVTGENARGGADRGIPRGRRPSAHGLRRRRREFLHEPRPRSGLHGWLAAHGLAPPLRAVGHYTMEGAAAAARALLSRPDRPDAIFCGNDHMAFAILEVARHEFGLRIPEDLSLVGFDDVGAARWRSFDLTSFSQPVERMVDLAVDAILALIEKPEQPPHRLIAEGELVVRGSSRVPPTGVERLKTGAYGVLP